MNRRAALVVLIALCVAAFGRPGRLCGQIVTTLTIGTESANDVNGPAVVDVPVSFDLSGVKIRSLTLQILYDSTKLSIANADVSLGSLIPDWTLTPNAATPGKLIVSVRAGTVLDSTGGELDGDILELNFHVNQGVSGFVPITFLTPTATSQGVFNTAGVNIAATTTFDTGGIYTVPEPWSFALMALVLPALFFYGRRFGRPAA